MTSSQQNDQQRVQRLAQQQQTREFIDSTLTQMFAPQDEALRAAKDAPAPTGCPRLRSRRSRGASCRCSRSRSARSASWRSARWAATAAIWLARALPTADADLAGAQREARRRRARLAGARRAGGPRRGARRTGVRSLLPALQGEPPFDLVFIDADKDGYPTYLDWALKLTPPRQPDRRRQLHPRRGAVT